MRKTSENVVDIQTSGNQQLPGMESPENKGIHAKALEVKAFETERLNAQRKEISARADLLALMEAAQLEFYQRDGVTAKIKYDKKKVLVTLDDSSEE